MPKRKKALPIRFRRLLPVAATPVLLAASLTVFRAEKFVAQQAPTTAAPSFPLPSSLPSGTTVKVDGSDSMSVINEALKKRFEERFPGTKVDLAAGGTDAAIQKLLNGEISLAAIGRPLTQAETAKGLVERPISREKVAIIVGPDNPFNGSITADQFAKIFRGEITNWSQLGGPSAPIRLVDRPESSDTRRAISQYPVFRSAPFRAAAGATQIEKDDTGAVVDKLGKDGISYAIVSQVQNLGNVRILKLHDTLPDDPRYPFSQPRGYVYRGTPDPATQAFLGFAISRPGQEVVEAAKLTESGKPAEVAPSPAATATASPETTAPAPASAAAPAADTTSGKFPWWLWLLLPLIGIPLLWWLLKGRGGAAPIAAAKTYDSRIILTPRNCRDAYAYWEVADEHRADLRRQGGERPMVRLYDVTDIADMDRQVPHRVEEFPCREGDRDLHIPIAHDDRDYIAELGYYTKEGHWLKLARSKHVRVPACTPQERVSNVASMVAGGAAAAGAAALGATAIAHSKSTPVAKTEDPSRIILVPRNSRDAYAYWEVPESEKAALKQQGGEKLMLRLHDVTGIDPTRQAPHSVRQYECDERLQDKHITLPVLDTPTEPHGVHKDAREYLAELGYVTRDNRWLSLAKSAPVAIPAESDKSAAGLGDRPSPATSTIDVDRSGFDVANRGADTGIDDRLGGLGSTVSGWTADAKATAGAALAGGAAAVAGAGAAAHSWLDRGESPAAGGHPVVPGQSQDCRIILVPRNSEDAYAYWEVSESYKQAARDKGGRKLALRIHDATNLDIDYETPHRTDVYDILETDTDKHVKVSGKDPNGISADGRDYIAELGYFTDDNTWIRIIRSFHVRVPAND